MRIVCVTICFSGLGLLVACSEPPPPVTVEQLMQNPRLLEATMVRCGQNRTEMKYETECVNARDAVNRLQRAADRERRVQLEAESERKRQALRQTQEAVAAARRRSDEERRRREEDEYLGIFEETPQRQSGEVSRQLSPADNAPPPANNAPVAEFEPAPVVEEEMTEAAPPANNAPVAEIESAPIEESSDLDAVREELRRRQQAPEND